MRAAALSQQGYLFVEENVVGMRTPIPMANAPVMKLLVVGAGGGELQAGAMVGFGSPG
jgi:hypothetical protein